MRLIDADELMKDRTENDPVRIAAMCAPTAYDVNKVVEKINIDINSACLRYKECNFETPVELCMKYATEYEERKKFLGIVNSARIVKEEK